MGDKVKMLRKENNDLKSQLNDLRKEYISTSQIQDGGTEGLPQSSSYRLIECTGCPIPQRQLQHSSEVGIQLVKSSG